MKSVTIGRLASLLIFNTLFILICGLYTVRAPVETQAPQIVIPFVHTPACSLPLAYTSTNILLPVKRISQHLPYADDEESNVCWAAGIAMIANYLGAPVELCTITQHRTYAAFADCCLSSERIDSDSTYLCNQGATSNEIDEVLIRLRMYYSHEMKPLTEKQILNELAHGRPILVDRESNTIHSVFGITYPGRHIVVIIGYKQGKYVVHDPNPFATIEQHFSYSQLLFGINGKTRWRETWYELSFRMDRCNPSFVPYCSCEITHRSQ